MHIYINRIRLNQSSIQCNLIMVLESNYRFSVYTIGNSSHLLDLSLACVSLSFQIYLIELFYIFLLCSDLVWPVALESVSGIYQGVLHVNGLSLIISVVWSIKLQCISKNCLFSILTMSFDPGVSKLIKTILMLDVQLVKIWHWFMSSITGFNSNICRIRVMIRLLI